MDRKRSHINSATEQGVFDFGDQKDNPKLVSVEASSIDELVLNNYPAFGFDNEEVSRKMKNLFRRRSSIDDHLNFELIKGAFLGYKQVEVEKVFGISIGVLQQLDTPDIIALYYGIQLLKGKTLDLCGLTFGKHISKLVNEGYMIDGVLAQNAIRAMKQQQIGFAGHKYKARTIEQTMDKLDEQAKLLFLRSFYTLRFNSQESEDGYGIWDPIYALNIMVNGQPIDSNKARNQYVDEFIKLMKEKYVRGNDFETGRFQGWIVPSSSKQGLKYFVQRNVIFIPQNNVKEMWNCSCPHGIRSMYWGLPKNMAQECRHIQELKTV